MVKLKDSIGNVLLSLGTGAKRVDFDVELGEDFRPIVVCGYWIGNTIRIDVKLREN